MKGKLVVIVMAAVLALSGAAQGAATFFLSEAGYGEGATVDNPTFTILNVGDTATINVYGYVTAPDDLISVGLSIISADPLIGEAQSVVIHDPDYDLFGIPQLATSRWQGANEGPLGDLALETGAVKVDTGEGMVFDASMAIWDPLYDPTAGPSGAYLHATIVVEGTAEGQSDLHISVSGLMIAPADTDPATGKNAGDVEVFFGAGDGSVRGDSVGVLTQNREGLLVVLPEPATMALLAIGGLGVLIRRKR